MTTCMSCSISSTVRPRSSRSRCTNAVKSARLLRVHAGRRLVEQQRASAPSRAPARPRGGAGRRTTGCARTPRRPAPAGRRSAGSRARARRRVRSSRRRPGVRRTLRTMPPLRRQCMPTSTFSSAVIVVEQADVLERAADAELRDLVRRAGPRASCPSKTISPRRRRVDAGEHVEEGRLAGAVRADQADDRASRHREVDVVAGDQAAELLAQRARLEQVLAAVRRRRPRTAAWASSGTRAAHVLALDAELELGLPLACSGSGPAAAAASSSRSRRRRSGTRTSARRCSCRAVLLISSPIAARPW